MLKPEQVPSEAIRKAMREFGLCRDVPLGRAWERTIAAAINAWPGMFHHPARPDEEECIFLPVEQEPRDE